MSEMGSRGRSCSRNWLDFRVVLDGTFLHWEVNVQHGCDKHRIGGGIAPKPIHSPQVLERHSVSHAGIRSASGIYSVCIRDALGMGSRTSAPLT